MCLRTLLTLLLSLALLACKSESATSTLEEVNRQIESGIDQANQTARAIPEQAEKLGDAASAEISKLHALEYRVVEFDSGISGADLETQLKTLGSERWDCFHVRETSAATQLICKRYPQTFLRYVPKIF